MKLQVLNKEQELINIDELRKLIRIDDAYFDDKLKQYLQAGISEFEKRT